MIQWEAIHAWAEKEHESVGSKDKGARKGGNFGSV